MTTPRIEVDLNKIRENTRCLVDRLKSRGIDVTGVTKAVCGHPKIAQTMLDGGAVDLAESRVSNVRRLRKAGFTCPILMIRAPMLSQADQIIQFCNTSFNTEMTVMAALAAASIRAGTPHNVVLMVEMGDMREGIMPQDLHDFAQAVVEVDGVELSGIAANFACLTGVRPSNQTMRSFSDLATTVEQECGPFIESVSGGNSANLSWALGPEPTGRINNLRLGEAILLGVDPVSGEKIGGLYTDAFTMITEVIEAKTKSDHISVASIETAFGDLRIVPRPSAQLRSIVAIGRQDTDVVGLGFPSDITCLGSTSDHLVVTGNAPQIDQDLVALVADARRWAGELLDGTATSIPQITEREGLRNGSVSRILPLAWLAPDISTAILEGRQPSHLNTKILRALPELPLDWTKQRRVLGFATL